MVNGQNIPFYHDYNTILSSNGQMGKINRYFDNFNKNSTTKKFGILEIDMIKFGLTILTMSTLEFWGWSMSKLA
jgi:hypothetical protein